MQVVIQTDKRYLLKILPNSKVSTSCYLVDYHNCTCAANGDTNYCTDLDFKNLTKDIKDYRFSSFSSLSAAAAVGDYHNCTEALLMQLLPSNNFSTALHIEGELKKIIFDVETERQLLTGCENYRNCTDAFHCILSTNQYQLQRFRSTN